MSLVAYLKIVFSCVEHYNIFHYYLLSVSNILYFFQKEHKKLEIVFCISIVYIKKNTIRYRFDTPPLSLFFKKKKRRGGGRNLQYFLASRVQRHEKSSC